MEPILREVRLFLKEVVVSMDNNLCQSLMRIIDSFFVPFTETELKKVQPEDMAALIEMIDPLFIFAFTWSFCCTVDYDGRLKLNEMMRDLIKNQAKINFPEDRTIYSYHFDQT